MEAHVIRILLRGLTKITSYMLLESHPCRQRYLTTFPLHRVLSHDFMVEKQTQFSSVFTITLVGNYNGCRRVINRRREGRAAK